MLFKSLLKAAFLLVTEYSGLVLLHGIIEMAKNDQYGYDRLMQGISTQCGRRNVARSDAS
jgi:hypothetical protein